MRVNTNFILFELLPHLKQYGNLTNSQDSN